jgi:hypothetical protein
MSTVPEYLRVHIIIPLEGSINPAVGSLNDQVYPVQLEAVVEYRVIVVPDVRRQFGSMPDAMAIGKGVPTTGKMFTDLTV